MRPQSGLYALILKSRKPEAKTFRKWVTSEVLPSIRRNGAHMTTEVAIEVIEVIEVTESPMDAARRFLGVAVAEVGRLAPMAKGLDSNGQANTPLIWTRPQDATPGPGSLRGTAGIDRETSGRLGSIAGFRPARGTVDCWVVMPTRLVDIPSSGVLKML